MAADPVTSLLLLLVVGFPALLFVSAFSAQGYGKNNYTRSVAHEHMAWYTGCAGMFVVMVLYTLDFTHWAAKWLLNIKKLAVLAIGCLFVATVLFSAGDYPYGPACLFVVGLPIWLLKVKWIVMPKKDFRTYIGLMPLPMGLCALITFGYVKRTLGCATAAPATTALPPTYCHSSCTTARPATTTTTTTTTN